MGAEVPAAGAAGISQPQVRVVSSATYGVGGSNGQMRVVSYSDHSAIGIVNCDEASASDADIMGRVNTDVLRSGQTASIIHLADGSRRVLIEPRVRAQSATTEGGVTTFSDARVTPTSTARTTVMAQAKTAAREEARSFGMAGLLQQQQGSTNPTAAPVPSPNPWAPATEGQLPASAWTDSPTDPTGIEGARRTDADRQAAEAMRELAAEGAMTEAALRGDGPARGIIR